LTWIILALALALYGLLAKPLVLGLDLQGGVTLRYELDAADTADPNSTNLNDDIDSTAETLRQRINRYGIKESSITRQGVSELVIELPGSSKDESDTVKSIVSRVGRLEFRMAMRKGGEDDDTRNNVAVAEQLERLQAYIDVDERSVTAPDELDLSGLDVPVPDGTRYRWYAYSDELLAQRRGVNELTEEITIAGLLLAEPLNTGDFHLVKIEMGSDRNFTGADISETGATTDRKGGNAVKVDIRPDRAAAFGDWTEPNIGRMMCILLDGRLAQEPAEIQSRLSRDFVISSGKPTGFSQAEISEYLIVIKSGSLQMKPRLLYENTIGPSLGESSIKAGRNASIAGFLAVIAFMVLYYRMNGVIASFCLLLNMTLLGGILMFLEATLTLPGIAGLVLTLGIAVDANILVFERMREEADRAKSVGQAIKLGYEKAMSTILDANITTFVTAFILFKVGTGPVRGFSVILMLGIVTSVFSVLIIGRLIYDTLADRGFANLAMARLIKQDTKIPFMSKGKLALSISAVVVVLSLVTFGLTDRDKYGLDFLGGYKAHVLLSEPVGQAEVRDWLGDSIFAAAQVVSVDDEDGDTSTSRQFVIKLKSQADEDAGDVDLKSTYEQPLRTALGGRMLPDFVSNLSMTEDTAAASTAIAATLTFEAGDLPLTLEAVAGHLGFLTGANVQPAGDNAVSVTGSWARVDLDRQRVVQRMRTALAVTTDIPKPSSPFLVSTMISSRVGTELRDSAIQAFLLSFIAIVLYIRVRFHEYRYGFAAIVALAHDVSITLGVVAVAHFTGLVSVEIDLAMIAAFLTIIGYSLNDTIVLFDRIRENVPRLKGKSFEDILDISINQTLARTLLTSSSTLLALTIIFFFNRGRQNVLEGFSFAMIIGVLVGTYSSIFVASPVLTMLAGRGDEDAASAPRGSRKLKQGVPA
jgi:SecD/SecF fusion protein